MNMNHIKKQRIKIEKNTMETITFRQFIEELTGKSFEEFLKDFGNEGEKNDSESNLE
jgi:hypothetical protein